jgi:type II secretory pathway component GspD/PulD (secretin)
MTRTRLHLAALALCCSGGCALFEPTIPERAEAAELPETVAGPVEPEPAPLPVDPEPAVQEESQREPPRVGDDRLLSFELRDMPLAQALHLIGESAGVNLYLDAGLDRPVDASFPNVTLDAALQTLLARNGLSLVEDPPGMYWVTATDGSQAETAWFRVQSIDADSILEDLEALVGESARVVVNAEQNLVVVDGTARDADLVAGYLEGVDRLKRQVLLEVEIVELLLDEGFEIGFSHLISGGDVGDSTYDLLQTLLTTNDNFTLTLNEDDIPLTSTLQMLEQYVGINLISSPRVLAVTKTPSLVEVTTEVPYIESTVNTEVGDGTAGLSTVQEVEFKTAGIKLEATPIVQEGGAVEISLMQELSEVVDFFSGVPVIDTRKLENTLVVQDGATVVLGGLRQHVAQEADLGVPFLQDIPWLGRAFRSDEDSVSRRELVLFVTPHILDPLEAAQLAKTVRRDHLERSRMLGVPQLDDRVGR